MINEVLCIQIRNFNHIMIATMLKAHETYVEDKLNARFETSRSYLIRWCLENRIPINDQVLKGMLRTPVKYNEL